MPGPDLSPREKSVLKRPVHWLVASWDQLHRAWLRLADTSQHAWWFPLALGAVVAFDSFIIILPGDLMVALAVLSNPAAWRRTALAAGLGSALGAFGLYLAICQFSPDFLKRLPGLGAKAPAEVAAPLAQGRAGLSETQAAIEDALPFAEEEGDGKDAKAPPPAPALPSKPVRHFTHASLFVGSLLPGGSWPPVVWAGLQQWPALPVLGWLLLGRLLRFLLVGFGVREGWAIFKAVRQEAQKQRRD